MSLAKLTKTLFAGAAMCILNMLAGCVTYDYSNQARLDKKTCANLVAGGLDCHSNQSPGTVALTHVEFHQQLLPIHQRDDILGAELKDAKGSH
ncbi:hypothetical protein [Alteromonas facilis]|uniref:hypothetical protein n=1 Tax=Alteromonas facilis TaxID=2048004 RepID=UPI000C290FEC|nr:hypothetical protein [Alteromonas facilis]